MEQTKFADEELKQAFFILRHGSDEGLSEYVKAVLVIENEYLRQKAEIERLTEELDYFKKSSDYHEGNQKELEIQNAELQTQVDELRTSREIAINDLHEQHAIVAEGIKKDTAKEIELELEDKGYFEYGQFVISGNDFTEIFKKRGVEVDE